MIRSDVVENLLVNFIPKGVAKHIRSMCCWWKKKSSLSKERNNKKNNRKKEQQLFLLNEQFFPKKGTTIAIEGTPFVTFI